MKGQIKQIKEGNLKYLNLLGTPEQWYIELTLPCGQVGMLTTDIFDTVEEAEEWLIANQYEGGGMVK